VNIYIAHYHFEEISCAECVISTYETKII